MKHYLNEIIRISPGFKAAVNLRKERNNLQKVAGYIPTEVAREILLDFAKKLHPTTPDLRSRIVMGTYGTGKSHLALVLLNMFSLALDTPELQTVVEKLDPDTRTVLQQHRQTVAAPYLTVNLYGDEGNISDSLMMGLRHALAEAQLESILPPTAFDAANERIEEFEKQYPASFEILKHKIGERGKTIDELKTRLHEYQKDAFDVFRAVYPEATSGSTFEYTTRLDPAVFYEDICLELRRDHGYSGIAIFWDEFGHKMEEVVKDPSGREGLALQEFAECCNASAENQLHLYMFCHRSLKEYHDISRNASAVSHQQLEDDLRKIEGRFKQYILKSTDVETFQLINGVIVADIQSPEWNTLNSRFESCFKNLLQETAQLNYFTGFTREELRKEVILGAYPLHPMAVYSLPAVSEKVAQNNRTLFTCLCEDAAGGFKRFLDSTLVDYDAPDPPFFTVERLWDYFATDVKQQERTYSIYRDYNLLKARLADDDVLGLRILKAVSIFRISNPTRFKLTDKVLMYALNIPSSEHDHFLAELARHADLKNENHILMRLQSDGSYRPAVSSSTETLIEKILKIVDDTPEKLGQKPILYLKSLWHELPVEGRIEATDYGDDYGVYRHLIVEPVSMYQLRERLHILTKNIGDGNYDDGLLLMLICENSVEIEEARRIAETTLADQQYHQILLAIPTRPIQISRLIMEYQALSYIKLHEANLYAEGGELHEEWRVWDEDKRNLLTDTISEIVIPEKQALEYYWKGQQHDVQNNRQLKKLASGIMREVFPYCPYIGEQKLAIDDFSGNWGYRKDCRDITLKLARSGAAETLWKENAAAQKHIITMLLKNNGILQKNQAGDIVIDQPHQEKFSAAWQVWQVISDYLEKARQRPVEMKKIVTRLRQPPFGLKCRAMPILFAAVAHHELVLGNVSFEFQKSATRVERITVIENETLEKIFMTPEKYRLLYINVPINQKALVDGMANVFGVMPPPADPPLERVKKVGMAIGNWWRSLAKHAQTTNKVSDGAQTVRDHIFRPLAELEPDIHQILLKDTFEHVFQTDANTKVKQGDIEKLFKEFKAEFEDATVRLREGLLGEFYKYFEPFTSEGTGGVQKWFSQLPEPKRNYVYHGDPAVLINCCREAGADSKNVALTMAEKFTGLKIDSWADEMVFKFGAKLESAKSFIESFAPPVVPPVNPPGPEPTPPPNHASLTIRQPGGGNNTRNFEIIESLSQNGRALENMLNTTMEQIGRGIDEKEKMVIIYRFLKKHFFGNTS